MKRSLTLLLLSLWLAVIPAFGNYDEVTTVLEAKAGLVKELLKNPVVVDALRSSNQSQQTLLMEEILARDRHWQEVSGLDATLLSYLSEPCNEQLSLFQSQHGEFSEIFISNQKGTNVCLTNKTSDYYQADESWWTDTFRKGAGQQSFGEIEYDESASAQSIPIYLPIRDPDGAGIIGVCKVIVSLQGIIDAL